MDLRTTEITLNTGFLRGGERQKQLVMREPTVADNMTINQVTKDVAQRELRLFSALCEITPEEVQTLTMADYGRLQDAYTAFLS
jgi:hypothetical protein